ncbi:hypothetical protein CPC08DRAFT_142752 [Agrocybe pediades]|nr:hypothetical protein CPC08DRAFT_142752 [Agrocybe pediades]
MGRPLYSLRYTAPEPAIRTEPEPKVDTCETWSAWNRFDPDSEEFFHDAEYEAFINPSQPVQNIDMSSTMVIRRGGMSSASSDTSESSASDEGSPAMDQSEEIPDLVEDSFDNDRTVWRYNVDVEVNTTTGDSEWQNQPTVHIFAPTPSTNSTLSIPSRVSQDETSSPRSTDQQASPAFIPPAAFRNTTPDISVESARNRPTIITRPPVRRSSPINITPIFVSRNIQSPPPVIIRASPPGSPTASVAILPVSRPASPTPASATHVNPTSIPSPQRNETLYTPSPPPSVTPLFYSWNTRPISGLQGSPTLSRNGIRDGPFTNPRARMSYARIEASPARIRIPGPVL